MQGIKALILAPAVVGLAAVSAEAQLGMLPKETRVAITAAWTGARADDGRPLVPDAILERLREATAEEAWEVLVGDGYTQQFEGGWKTIGVRPERRLVGRVVTAAFLPRRPDLNDYINSKGVEESRVKSQNSWVIATLRPGDVLVVDLYGKVNEGTYAGDKLSTAIFTKSGTGLVVDGAVRDVSGISEIEGFQVYVRDFHPTALRDATLAGINVPIRIGETTVLPGDVLLSDPEGLTFIPPHLAEKVANHSETVRLEDDWSHEMLRAGRYTPGQVDSQWTDEMRAEFARWKAARKRGR
jgi:regulator of RNase E activity RraA